LETNHPQTPGRAYLALATGALTLGFSAIFVSLADAPGAVSAFYRMSIATLILAWPFLRAVRAKGRISRKGVRLAVWAGIFFAADLAAWMTGVGLSGATNPTLLANTAPLWVGLGAMLVFREKLNLSFWVGLALALGGATLILGLDLARAANFGLGSLYGLLAGFFYGIYFLFIQRTRENLDSLSSIWITGFTSTVILLALVFILGQPLSGYSSLTYANFLGMGVVTQVIGYLAITYSLGHLPASLVSPTLLVQPVLTALLAGPLLGEAITSVQVGGGLVVLTGVFLVHRSRRASTKAKTLKSTIPAN
jgi:drug/metabolite transporter (DMT)-like permease